jgi:hypothetical protein
MVALGVTFGHERRSFVMPTLADVQHGHSDEAEKTHTFRCYAYKAGNSRFIGECVDLDIIVEENSLQNAVDSLNEAVEGFLHVALEGDPRGLVPRYSPLSHRFLYHFRVLVHDVLRFVERKNSGGFKKFDLGCPSY